VTISVSSSSGVLLNRNTDKTEFSQKLNEAKLRLHRGILMQCPVIN